MFKGKNNISISDNGGILEIQASLRGPLIVWIIITVLVVGIEIYMWNLVEGDMLSFLIFSSLVGIGLLLGLAIPLSMNRQHRFDISIDKNRKIFEANRDKFTLKFEEIKNVRVVSRQLQSGIVATSPGVVIPTGGASISGIAIDLENGERMLSGSFINFDDASRIVGTMKSALGIK